MQAKEIMTEAPACCTPEDRAEEAARLMHENDCGAIPVVEEQGSHRLVGVVTDRDIAVRGVAQGRGPETRVSELMTSEPECCPEDADVHEVEDVMKRKQVRRVPIIDARGELVGIIAQADLARSHGDEITDEEVGEVVERISEPGRRVRSAQAD